jgi:membrane protein YdbS with pleckstrin-like domain
MTVIDLKTKACPFCAETIQAAAVKCRFCGEFLNTEKARKLISASQNNDELSDDEQDDDDVLFAGRPSLLGLAWTVIKVMIVIVLAGLLIKFPLENFIKNLPGLKLTGDQVLIAGRYRIIAAYGLVIITILILFIKILKLKMIYYEVNADRIEWSRGILDRKVDNLDMFRVVDLKLRRNIFDCIFGIGTVALVTTDKTDPKFEFEKVRNCRLLYDVIKKASLAADRKTGVVHLE